jgi:hypothetical protein
MGSNLLLERKTTSPLRYDYGAMIEIRVGKVYDLLMPYSEVAMACRIAGTIQTVKVCANGVYLDGGNGPYLTYGEAGIYNSDKDGLYAYEPDLTE